MGRYTTVLFSVLAGLVVTETGNVLKKPGVDDCSWQAVATSSDGTEGLVRSTHC